HARRPVIDSSTVADDYDARSPLEPFQGGRSNELSELEPDCRGGRGRRPDRPGLRVGLRAGGAGSSAEAKVTGKVAGEGREAGAGKATFGPPFVGGKPVPDQVADIRKDGTSALGSCEKRRPVPRGAPGVIVCVSAGFAFGTVSAGK